MKKILSLTLAMALTFTLASCTQKKDDEKNDNKNNNVVIDDKNTESENNDAEVGNVVNSDVVYSNPDLLSLADGLYATFEADELPALASMEISADDFEYYAFIPYEEGLKAVVSEPMMGSIAHSVVLVEAADHAKAIAVSEAMKENANPRKWIRVEAEKVEVGVNGNIAVLIMSDEKTDELMKNFKAVNSETMPVLSGDSNEAEEKNEDADTKNESVDKNDKTDVKPSENKPVDAKPVESKPVDAKPVEVTPSEDNKKTDVTVPAEEEKNEKTEEQPKNEAEGEEKNDAAPVETVTIDKLYEIADKLYEGIDPDDMPFMGTRELTEENFEYSAFVPYNSEYLAVESMAAMGSIPHSVVIVKAQSAAEASSLAESMKSNANPRKWVCVQARSVKSAAKGEYAILVMTSVDIMPDGDTDEDIDKAEALSDTESAKRADIIIANFKAAI